MCIRDRYVAPRFHLRRALTLGRCIMCAAIIFFRALLVLLKWATTAGSSLFFLHARDTRIASVEKVMWFQQCRTRVMAGLTPCPEFDRGYLLRLLSPDISLVMMRLFCISTKNLASSPVTVLVGSEFFFVVLASLVPASYFIGYKPPCRPPSVTLSLAPIFVLLRLNKI